jgi:hypothetical protein
MKETVLQRAARRAGRNGFAWRYLLNFRSALLFRLSHPALRGEAARVLAGLNRDGVAVTSVERLLADDASYRELVSDVSRMQKELSGEPAAARGTAGGGSDNRKPFVHFYLGECPELQPDSAFARFALQEPVLHIANAYFGMFTRLSYYNVWHNFATQAEARESQLWHRDREDHYILKMFVYLSDVDESAGPFTYALGSHNKGRLRREPEATRQSGVMRSDDAQMAAAVPPNRWLKAVGPRGTIVFADTRGYHKGGLTRDRDRLLFVSMFTSQSVRREYFRYTGKVARPSGSARAFALSSPRGEGPRALRNGRSPLGEITGRVGD